MSNRTAPFPAGYGVNRPTLWNTFGNVTNKLERVEPIVQEHVFSKYPDRA